MRGITFIVVLTAGLLMAGAGTSGGGWQNQACANRTISAVSSNARCVAAQRKAGMSGAACSVRPVVCVDYKKYNRWDKKRKW